MTCIPAGSNLNLALIHCLNKIEEVTLFKIGVSFVTQLFIFNDFVLNVFDYIQGALFSLV